MCLFKFIFQLRVLIFDNLFLICLVVDVAFEKLFLFLLGHLSGVMLPNLLVLDILLSLLHPTHILIDLFQLEPYLPVDLLFLFKTQLIEKSERILILVSHEAFR